MDGAGRFRIFLTIIIPLSTPVITALAIFTFLGNWNSYLWPIISATSSDVYTIVIGLRKLNQAWGDVNFTGATWRRLSSRHCRSSSSSSFSSAASSAASPSTAASSREESLSTCAYLTFVYVSNSYPERMQIMHRMKALLVVAMLLVLVAMPVAAQDAIRSHFYALLRRMRR